jgi:hypothetical protein
VVVVVVDIVGESPVYRSKLSEFLPAFFTTYGVALMRSCASTSAGDKLSSDSRMSAAAPATCGAAMDVPLSVREAVSDLMHADRTSTPGAKISMHEP